MLGNCWGSATPFASTLGLCGGGCGGSFSTAAGRGRRGLFLERGRPPDVAVCTPSSPLNIVARPLEPPAPFCMTEAIGWVPGRNPRANDASSALIARSKDLTCLSTCRILNQNTSTIWSIRRRPTRSYAVVARANFSSDVRTLSVLSHEIRERSF